LASFVGLAPVSDPRIVVAVMVDEPTGPYYGGLIAAPVFAQITAATLRTLQVAPDGPMEETKSPRLAMREAR